MAGEGGGGGGGGGGEKVLKGSRFYTESRRVSRSTTQLYRRLGRSALEDPFSINSTRGHEPLLGSGLMPRAWHKRLYTSTARIGPARKFFLKSVEKRRQS